MRNKLYWGLGILIVLLIGVFVFVMVNEYAENDQIEAESKEAENLADSINRRKAENRPPPPGKSFEGGGHWHGDEWHDAPHEPTEQVVQPIVKTKKYDKPLTYDAELLKNNPVEAMIREAKARGHWASEFIPPFPPDDLEAQTLARYEYMITFMNIQDAEELWDIVLKKSEMLRRMREKYGLYDCLIKGILPPPRYLDLQRLLWIDWNSPYDVAPDFYSLQWRSEYFPDDQIRNSLNPKF